KYPRLGSLTGGGTLVMPAMLMKPLYENSNAKFKMQILVCLSCRDHVARQRPTHLCPDSRQNRARLRRRVAGLATRKHHLHFELLDHGLAGSISTAMLRHFCCLNRATLRTQRVKWPSTIAVQMSAGIRVRVAWMIAHRPSGTAI